MPRSFEASGTQLPNPLKQFRARPVGEMGFGSLAPLDFPRHPQLRSQSRTDRPRLRAVAHVPAQMQLINPRSVREDHSASPRMPSRGADSAVADAGALTGANALARLWGFLARMIRIRTANILHWWQRGNRKDRAGRNTQAVIERKLRSNSGVERLCRCIKPMETRGLGLMPLSRRACPGRAAGLFVAHRRTGAGRPQFPGSRQKLVPDELLNKARQMATRPRIAKIAELAGVPSIGKPVSACFHRRQEQQPRPASSARRLMRERIAERCKRRTFAAIEVVRPCRPKFRAPDALPRGPDNFQFFDPAGWK